MSSETEDGPQRLRTPPIYLEQPSKTSEAKKAFQELNECIYHNKSLGDSGQDEYMTCDCHEQWSGKLHINTACGDDSGCINRATSVECLIKTCGCGTNCQNQRFQRKQYAPITVFQTELKGYGVRADAPLDEGAFIYEYIGEVIDEVSFRKRMVDYDTKNFKHFYFMMLKKDSFIDATVKGSLARFVNHSCSPNAYVDKWVVGDKLRMGIFAKRSIAKGEEITFDYNVDRYGAQSQPCYCGEPNCIKFMGGKTQTDAALLLPEGISEALGVSLQQEKKWLKENKHLRTKQQKDDSIVNEQFVKSIESSELDNAVDVTRVMAALMKSQDVNIIKKLIERIYLTTDANINLHIVKMHGYKTLSTILKGYGTEDDEIITMILKVLRKWPTMTRNKISSSQIEDVIKHIQKSTRNREIKGLSADLLKEWGQLKMAYRIPKLSESNRSNSPESDTKDTPTSDTNGSNGRPVSPVKPQPAEDELPPGWGSTIDPNTKKVYYFNRELNQSTWTKPEFPKPVVVPPTPQAGNQLDVTSIRRRDDVQSPYEYSKQSTPISIPKGPRLDSPARANENRLAEMEADRLQREKEELFKQNQTKQKSLQELIAQSQREAIERKQLEEKMKQESIEKAKAKARAKAKAKSKDKPKSSTSTTSTSANSAEKQWGAAFAHHVPNFIKKYESEIGRELVKQNARDVVHILVKKEMAKDATKAPPPELDNAKLKKVKDFTRGYMDKFLIKYQAKKKHPRESEDNANGTNDDQENKRAKH